MITYLHLECLFIGYRELRFQDSRLIYFNLQQAYEIHEGRMKEAYCIRSKKAGDIWCKLLVSNICADWCDKEQIGGIQRVSGIIIYWQEIKNWVWVFMNIMKMKMSFLDIDSIWKSRYSKRSHLEVLFCKYLAKNI